MVTAVAIARVRESAPASSRPNTGPTWADEKKVSRAVPAFQPHPLDEVSSRISEAAIISMNRAGVQASQRSSRLANQLVTKPPLRAPAMPAGPLSAPM